MARSVIYEIKKSKVENIKVVDRFYGQYVISVNRYGQSLGIWVISPSRYKKFQKGGLIRLTVKDKRRAELWKRMNR